MSLVTVEGLRIEFGTRAQPLVAVNDVSFEIAPGEILGLVGESGSGKSLTSRALMNLVAYPGRVAAGRVMFDGSDVLDKSASELRAFRAREVGMIFQDPFSSLNPVFRVGAQLSETLRLNVGLSRSAARTRAIEMLDRVGIADPERRYRSYPHELSGGMRQRVMIALATASQPRLLLADEPTTALDVTTQEQILRLLSQMQRDFGMSMLLVSHDFGVIAQVCDRVAVMYGGRIVETGPVNDIYDSPRHPYTKALLASVPDLEAPRGSGRRNVMPGQPPEISADTGGCVFRARCPYATEECAFVPMILEPLGGEHRSACPFVSPLAATVDLPAPASVAT